MGRWVPALLGCVALLGCEARLDPGASCTLTSECAEPLACVAGRCRSECSTARDCPRGSICLAGGGGVSACQLLPSVGDDCTGSAECGGRLVCLEGRCTDACATDDECVAGASCHPSAGCVECVTDADCPRTLRCDVGHRCAPECASDGDCAPGLVCRADRCALPSVDGGEPVEPRPPVENDRCEDALTIPLPAAPFSIVYRARATGWTDDIPSCSPSPDGFIRFEPAARTLVHFGCEDSVSGLAPIESCSASVADCSERDFQHAHHILPDQQLFAYDSDQEEPELWFCMQAFPLGAGTVVSSASEGLIDLTLELSGEGAGECESSGPDALFALYLAGGASVSDLTAEAPGVELRWQDATEASCEAPSMGSAMTTFSPVGLPGPYRHMRLIARGASGPVTVRITGRIVHG